MAKGITIKVKNTKQIPWKDLKQWEFNDLKDKDRDINKLKMSILKRGFCFPFYIWEGKEYVIDGNGRNLALTELEKEGFKIPDLPVVEIEAKNKKEAKDRVLQANAEYGNISPASFSNFLGDDIKLVDIDDIKLPDYLTAINPKAIKDKGVKIKEIGDEKPVEPKKKLKHFTAYLSIAEYDEFRKISKQIIAEEGINHNAELLMFLIRKHN